MKRVRRAVPYVLALSIASGITYHRSTTRGYLQVHDRLIAGAVVLLADSAGIVASTRTDAGGYFRFVHGVDEAEGYHLLFCAAGFAPTPVKVNPALESRYSLMPVQPPDFPMSIRSLGWKHPIPSDCPNRDSYADAGSHFTFTQGEKPVNSIIHALGTATWVLFAVLLFCAPLFALIWFVRVLSDLRDGQRRLVQITAAIHTEMRERVAREAWNQTNRR